MNKNQDTFGNFRIVDAFQPQSINFILLHGPSLITLPAKPQHISDALAHVMATICSRGRMSVAAR